MRTPSNEKRKALSAEARDNMVTPRPLGSLRWRRITNAPRCRCRGTSNPCHMPMRRSRFFLAVPGSLFKAHGQRRKPISSSVVESSRRRVPETRFRNHDSRSGDRVQLLTLDRGPDPREGKVGRPERTSFVARACRAWRIQARPGPCSAPALLPLIPPHLAATILGRQIIGGGPQTPDTGESGTRWGFGSSPRRTSAWSSRRPDVSIRFFWCQQMPVLVSERRNPERNVPLTGYCRRAPSCRT